jgi:hypothetical protein
MQSILRSRHLVPWLCGCGMTFMVAALIGRTADSLASIPERLAQPAVERPYALPEIEATAHDGGLDQLDATWLEHRIRPGESFYKVMRAMGFDPGTVQSVMDAGKQAQPLMDLRPGQVLRASAPDGELQALDLEIDALNRLMAISRSFRRDPPRPRRIRQPASSTARCICPPSRPAFRTG